MKIYTRIYLNNDYTKMTYKSIAEESISRMNKQNGRGQLVNNLATWFTTNFSFVRIRLEDFKC
ncbi:hypothetical protein C0J52_00624 [Blattella germanica]|nr:hypothetical protein C0J52_00624 [Blattella germanica]